MGLSAKVAPAVLALTTLLQSGLAQQTPSQPATRPLIVNVFDRSGKVLDNLNKENFRVRLDGKPATVTDARYSFAPRRIVILLDVSSSIAEEGERWQIARRAAADLLTRTPREVPIAMLTFSTQVRDVLDFRQGRESMTNLLNPRSDHPQIGKHAKTALLDAVLSGLKLLQPYQAGDAIYAITDGDDNASQTPPPEFNRAVLNSGVRLFAFLFPESYPEQFPEHGRHAFFSMIDNSGGSKLVIPGMTWPETNSHQINYGNEQAVQEKIRRCTQELNALVHGFWTLEIETAELKKETRIHLEIADGAGETRKDVQLLYPQTLSAR
jgi:VWA domain-containing protein